MAKAQLAKIHSPELFIKKKKQYKVYTNKYKVPCTYRIINLPQVKEISL